MKILVIGSGGREHALAWKLRQSSKISALYCAPGNGGIAQEAKLVPIAVEKIEALAQFVQQEKIDLTAVGPELPLTLGLVDYFQQRGLCAIGPTQAAAQLEGSKIFAKQFMQRHKIPTAAYATADSAAVATQLIRRSDMQFPLVIKADGLAAGKGVIIAQNPAEADHAIQQLMQDRVLGQAADRVIIEEFMEGEEVSFLAFSDGEHVLPMVPSQDHKRILDADQGPNTGGMGAYSTDWLLNPEQHSDVMNKIIIPAIQGMAAEGTPYRGILYAGLMLTRQGPKVVEFNVRMGDPETQPVLFRMKSDLVDVLKALAAGRLDQVHLEWESDCSVCVVLASGGYPGKYQTGKLITGLREADALPGVKVFHAGTALKDGQVITMGGRVLGVTARGATLKTAIDLAYEASGKIHFDNMHYRRDIAAKGLRRSNA